MAVGVLVDSDVVIQYLRRDEAVTRPFDALLVEERLAWTPVSIAEVVVGLRPAEAPAAAAMLGAIQTVPLTDAVGLKAGLYLQRYRPSHGLLVPDSLVAAAAHVHGLRLWTRNVKHYPMRDIRLYRTGARQPTT